MKLKIKTLITFLVILFMLASINAFASENATNKQKITRFEENENSVLFYGSWTNNYNTYVSNSSGKYSNIKGAYVQFEFYGTGIKIIGYAGQNKGIAKITIDNVAEEADFYTRYNQPSNVAYIKEGLNYGKHIIKVEVTGRKNINANNSYIYIDAFDVIDSPVTIKRHEESDSTIYFSGIWTNNKNPNCSGKGGVYSKTPGSYIKYTFNGTGIRVIGYMDKNKGIININIDGKEQIIDLYSKNVLINRNLYEKTNLNDGQHTIIIKVTGGKCSQSIGPYFYFDAFDVISDNSNTIKISKTINQNEQFSLPDKISVSNNNIEQNLNVKWESTFTDTSRPGTYTFNGTAENDKKVVYTLIIKSISKDLDIKEIAKNSKSVVCLNIKDKSGEITAIGSGFIVSSDGIVVTNYHVIEDAYSAEAVLEDGTKYMVEGVFNYNKDSDIAVLKLKGAQNLPTVILGDSDLVEIADKIVAIGSPEGYKNTVSDGIVSGLNRESATRKGNDIQITAGIAHGSSGGALFNMKGEVIGITYAGINTTGNLGFAIPINEVKPYLKNGILKPLSEVNVLLSVQPPSYASYEVISDTEVYLQWSEVDGADYYKVYHSYYYEGPYEDSVHKDGEYKGQNRWDWDTDYSLDIISLSPGEMKYYKITAVKGGVESQGKIIAITTSEKMNYEEFGENLKASYPGFTLNGYYTSIDSYSLVEDNGTIYIDINISGIDNYNNLINGIIPDGDNTSTQNIENNQKLWEDWFYNIYRDTQIMYSDKKVIGGLWAGFSQSSYPTGKYYKISYNLSTGKWDVSDWISMFGQNLNGGYEVIWLPYDNN